MFAILLSWSLASAFAPNQVLQKKIILTSPFKSTMEANDIKTEIAEEYMPASMLPPMYNRPAIASHRLSAMDIQRAIVDVKKFVEHRLETDLNLIKVSTV